MAGDEPRDQSVSRRYQFRHENGRIFFAGRSIKLVEEYFPQFSSIIKAPKVIN